MIENLNFMQYYVKLFMKLFSFCLAACHREEFQLYEQHHFPSNLLPALLSSA